MESLKLVTSLRMRISGSFCSFVEWNTRAKSFTDSLMPAGLT